MAAVATLLPAALAGAVGGAGSEFHFSATVGGGQVLLRWTPTQRPAPYQAYILMKREAAEPSLSNVGPVPIIPMTDPNAIEAVFPGGSEIRAEVTRPGFLVPDLGPDLASALLALRSSADSMRRIQAAMLLNTNYGVAIVEGLGYLDADVVEDSLYIYEVWGVDPNTDPTEPVERLGKLWVKASDTVLPPPTLLTAVTVPGEVGDAKVFLRWDATPDPRKDRETMTSGFGYDVYRLAGGADPNATIPDPVVPVDDPNSGAVKVNTEPVIPVPTTDPTEPNFFFVDGHPGIDPNASVLVRGNSYKYWLVARDLLRRHGSFSAPLQVCVPDQSRPRQVTGVRTKAITSGTLGVEVSWKANASDPNTIGGGMPYVDDTVAYHVYRSIDPNALLGSPDPILRIATDTPNTTFLDTVPAQAANQGSNFWYAVTAVDSPRCNLEPNESFFSAPTRGIYYDITGPTIAQADPFCDPNGTLPNPLCIRDCGHSLGPAHEWCTCGGASGLWPLPSDRWGYRVAQGAVPADTRTVRLYRGFKGKDYRPVEESLLGTAAPLSYELQETFSSRISQKIEYRLRALDGDSNLGPSVEPKGDVGLKRMPAFVRGGPPLPPVIIRSSPLVLAGSLTVRWHAAGAEALAGFVLRNGPREDPTADQFRYLPLGNLYSETSVPPGVDPNICDDFDGGGRDPKDIIITDATIYLADLIAVDPTLGGLRDPVTGYFQHTFAPADFDGVVEVFAVDIAGQLSAPALISRLRDDRDPGTLSWPERDLPLTFTAAGMRVPDPMLPAEELIQLCWDQGAGPGSPGAGDPTYVAVFRSVVEVATPRGYQQRSPLLDIGLYGNTSHCSLCTTRLSMLTGGPVANPGCWEDHDIAAGTVYAYSVVGLKGPPGPGVEGRDEREIQAVFGPVTCPPGEPCRPCVGAEVCP